MSLQPSVAAVVAEKQPRRAATTGVGGPYCRVIVPKRMPGAYDDRAAGLALKPWVDGLMRWVRIREITTKTVPKRNGNW